MHKQTKTVMYRFLKLVKKVMFPKNFVFRSSVSGWTKNTLLLLIPSQNSIFDLDQNYKILVLPKQNQSC
jgi:hypothetical protein